MVNYPPVIGAPEHTDSIHSGVYPCATWTGDSKGANEVFTYKSETNYPGGIVFVTFAGPDAGYLIGGSSGLETYAPGAYVSKFNPSTGKEIWRQPLLNININGQFNPAPSMAVGTHGVYAAFGAHVYRLDPASGAILAHREVHVLDGPQSDANFDGFHILPDPNGNILLKTQNRVPGCTTYGNYALSSCPGATAANPKTTVAVLSPRSLDVLDRLELTQAIVARPIVTTCSRAKAPETPPVWSASGSSPTPTPPRRRRCPSAPSRSARTTRTTPAGSAPGARSCRCAGPARAPPPPHSPPTRPTACSSCRTGSCPASGR
jgi:hypothetical protein